MYPTPSDAPDSDPDLPSAASFSLSPEKDQYLHILSIGFYVAAAVSFLFGLIPVIHVVFGVAMMTGATIDSGNQMAGAAVGCIFATIGLLIIGAMWTYSYFMVVAGRALRSRTRYVLCMVMAAISCMFAPVGTLVGVFTLILLLDDKVKLAFGVQPER
ncbi:MAG: hypothetical protein AAFY88_11010 [Acidobacteriota bacterium]